MSNKTNKQNNYEDNELVQSFSPELKELWDKVNVCKFETEEIVRHVPSILGTHSLDYSGYSAIASYLLAKVSDFSNPTQISFDEICKSGIDTDIIDFARDANFDKIWDELLLLLKKYQKNVIHLSALIHSSADWDTTPIGVLELASNLLNIQKNDRIAELCSGTGFVLHSIVQDYPSVKATGYEIDKYKVAVAKAYEDIATGGKVDFFEKDVFTLPEDQNSTIAFDKIFANYPFGLRLRELKGGKKYLENISNRIPSISKATSSDWIYNMLMSDLLTKNGKAIGIMTNGSTWNMIDAPIRKYFVENGLIESVIALPAKLFDYTSIATSMIILSHGNKGVRLVDASDLYTAGRRTNELTESDIEKIADMMNVDSVKSAFIDKENLRENDYVLNINRYSLNYKTKNEVVSFETVIKRITRGAPLSAKQLDSISSPVPTTYQYLMLSNIQNGIISSDLPYLKTIDNNNKKYCLSNRCLLLSKNGYPYKIAVAEIEKNQKIMANGNLYIIEIDEEKVNPYYLAAFFGSESGTAALKSITVGATVPNIGVDQLKKLIIPLPPMEKQKEIADCYQQTKDEINLLQGKIEKARNRLLHIIEEE